MDAFNGDYTKNPYYFANFGLTSIGFYVDSCSGPQETPFKLYYEHRLYTLPYYAIFGHKKGDLDCNNDILFSDFTDGYAIYVSNERSEKEFKRKALTRLNIDFKEPLKESVTVVTYTEFLDSLQIDFTGKVIESQK